jgi:nicotinamide-nucleotide amidase
VRAELLAVGSELLHPERRETNGTWITGRLEEIGIEVVARTTVADDAAVLESSFRTALRRAELVIATGGLGPTADDLTREAAAAAAGRSLRRDEAAVQALKDRFAHYGRVMPAVNEQQADLIEGARFLPNPRGTAPGQWLETDGRILVLLPGPPPEMEPMFEKQVLPRLRERAGGRVLRRRVLKIAGGESDVEETVAPLYRSFDNPTTTILGAPGMTELHLVARGATAEEAEARIEALASGLRERLGPRLFSEDGRELHQVVAALLVERRLTLAVAESCTGGMLAARLTSVPGSSAFLERGYVTYSNRAKVELLGVEAALLERHGAVSEQAASAMAAGARARSGADLALAITGIAGPDGGSEEKPVGYVCFDARLADGTSIARDPVIPGGREDVRERSALVGMHLLRLLLSGEEPPL